MQITTEAYSVLRQNAINVRQDGPLSRHRAGTPMWYVSWFSLERK